MDTWILFALFLFFSNGVKHASTERLNIVASPESACPGEFTGEPCLTLQQYVVNPSPSSDITLELQPGNHQLKVQLSAKNINSITIRAATKASVSCASDVRFYFEHLQLIYISDISFDNCIVTAQYVRNTTFVRNTIANVLHGTALLVYGSYSKTVYATINQCIFDTSMYLNSANTNILNSKFNGDRISNTQDRAIYVKRGELTITNTHFSDYSASNGGAVYVYSETRRVSITDSYFYNNTAGSNGGAVYVSSKTREVAITGSYFYNNTAGSNGGAVYVFSETRGVAITDSYFHNNRAGSNGGAVYVFSETRGVAITDSYFHNNRAGSNGGAVHVSGSNIRVSGTVFTNNTASIGGGGAIYSNARYANISLTNNTFSHNTAIYCGALDVDEFYHPSVNFTANTFTHNRAVGTLAGNDGGGVICIRNASVFIFDNNFSHNSAAGNAGVLRVGESEVTVERCVFDNNTAGDDGGVFHTYFYPTTYTITHSTFTNNQAGGDGGVMYVGRADSRVTIHQSTFNSNSAAERGGVIAIVGSTLNINRASVFENYAELGAVVSACNSNISISNPEIPATQDLVHPSCLLYGFLSTTVSSASQNTDHTTTAEETDKLTTVVSPTQDEVTSEGDTLTTIVFSTEEQTSTAEKILPTTVSTETATSSVKEDILATTSPTGKETATTEGGMLPTTALETSDIVKPAFPTKDDIFTTPASSTAEESEIPTEEQTTAEEDILTTGASPITTQASADAAQDDTIAFSGVGLGGAAVFLVTVLGVGILVHCIRSNCKSHRSSRNERDYFYLQN